MTNLGHVQGLENREEFRKPIHFKFQGKKNTMKKIFKID